jgi:hypothetical protein
MVRRTVVGQPYSAADTLDRWRDGVPDHGVPDHGVPDHGVPDHGVPDHGVPDAISKLPYPDCCVQDVVVSCRMVAAMPESDHFGPNG